MKTLFIPLDERPCNYNFPLMIAQSNQQIELVEPDKSFLGHKKKPAQWNILNNLSMKILKDVIIVLSR